MQDIFFGAEKNRVSGIVATRVTDNDVRLLGEHVNDFTFAFVTPLGADQNCVCHNFLAEGMAFCRPKNCSPTIKIPERKFGAKRVSLPEEVKKAICTCQFRRENFWWMEGV
jgi:hypothetical protein